MAQRITPPRKPLNDADTQLACECAIDVAVRDLVDEIIQAGWPPRIAYAAMRDVIENQLMAYLEDPEPAEDREEGRHETRAVE